MKMNLNNLERVELLPFREKTVITWDMMDFKSADGNSYSIIHRLLLHSVGMLWGKQLRKCRRLVPKRYHHIIYNFVRTDRYSKYWANIIYIDYDGIIRLSPKIELRFYK